MNRFNSPEVDVLLFALVLTALFIVIPHGCVSENSPRTDNRVPERARTERGLVE